MTEKIFVFVPSYNHAPFIEKTLRSIFAQTFSPVKLLVIDDGSKDNSVEIIRRVLKDCPFDCELITRANKGLSATLNEGFAYSNNEDFFAYLGSDDIWFPIFLEEKIRLLNSRPNAVLAFGNAFLIDEEENIIDSTAEWFRFDEKQILKHLLNGEIFPSSSVVYRRKFLAQHKWNENSILEDYELYLKLASEYEFVFDEKILSAWRQHGANVSGNFPKMLDEWLAAQNRVADKLPISREELDKIQTELRFKSVADFVRYGDRKKAFTLFRENINGAKSASQIGKLLLRLIVPTTIFNWNRQRKRAGKVKNYGNLREILEKKQGRGQTQMKRINADKI